MGPALSSVSGRPDEVDEWVHVIVSVHVLRKFNAAFPLSKGSSSLNRNRAHSSPSHSTWCPSLPCNLANCTFPPILRETTIVAIKLQDVPRAQVRFVHASQALL